jgi:hypothetical protein
LVIPQNMGHANQQAITTKTPAAKVIASQCRDGVLLSLVRDAYTVGRSNGRNRAYREEADGGAARVDQRIR